MTKFINVGQILKSKAGKLYIKVKDDVDLKKDEAVHISDATEKFERMLNAGKMSESEYEAEVEAHSENGRKHFVKYDLTLIRD